MMSASRELGEGEDGFMFCFLGPILIADMGNSHDGVILNL